MRFPGRSMLLAALAASSPALAADVSETYGEPDPGRFSFEAGATVLIVPKYEGSDDYRVIGFPVVIPSFGSGDGEGLGDRLTVRGVDDVRFALFRQGIFEVGPAGGWTFGREEDDAERLEGLGDVDGGVTLGAYGAINLDPFFVDVAYLQQITGDTDGGQLKFNGGLRTEVAPKLDMTASVGATYANSDYMNSFFSVTPEQSLESGLDAFTAEDGFKSVSADLEFDYGFNDKLTLSASAGYSRLVGDAADSPIIETENQFRGSLGFTYAFGPF